MHLTPQLVVMTSGVHQGGVIIGDVKLNQRKAKNVEPVRIVVLLLIPLKAPGYHRTGPHRDFRKDGTAGLEEGMSEDDCIAVARRKGWEAVGHRPTKGTCFRYDNGRTDLAAWFDSGGDVNDKHHNSYDLTRKKADEMQRR